MIQHNKFISSELPKFIIGMDMIVYYKGLAEYYATNPHYNVYFHIVGEFTAQREREECIPIIKNNHLEPFCYSSRATARCKSRYTFLNDVISGARSLGRHRSGITNIKTLKKQRICCQRNPIYLFRDRRRF